MPQQMGRQHSDDLRCSYTHRWHDGMMQPPCHLLLTTTHRQPLGPRPYPTNQPQAGPVRRPAVLLLLVAPLVRRWLRSKIQRTSGSM